MADLTTHFVLIRPHTDRATWMPDAYPWDDLLDLLEQRPVDRRQQVIGQLTQPLTYQVHNVGTKRLLSIHQVDVAARRSESQRGAISVREFGQAEGPTNASHLLPIEDDIFGLAIETGGPGRARVGTYIGVLEGHAYEPTFMPIERTDGADRLKSMTTASSVSLTAASSPIATRGGTDAFTSIFKAVAQQIDADEIRITVKVNRRKAATAAWFRKTRPDLEQFLGGDRAAIIDARAGNEKLLETAVTSTAHRSNTRGAVPAGDVIFTIDQQYGDRRDEIQESLGRKP